jgi:hypothetical protein
VQVLSVLPAPTFRGVVGVVLVVYRVTALPRKPRPPLQLLLRVPRGR